MVVVTDGKEGSFGYDGKKIYKQGIFPAEVVDMTGAGDGFAVGALAGLIHGKDLPEAMRWGAANGASVVKFIGAQEGLLSYDKMQEVLKI
jgi:fructoselysine 6-kinase